MTESMLTITHVDTTSDLRYARVYISALNCADEKGLMKGLKSAAGYLRHELGQAIDLRYTPELQFTADDSIEYGAHILEMLRDRRCRPGPRQRQLPHRTAGRSLPVRKFPCFAKSMFSEI